MSRWHLNTLAFSGFLASMLFVFGQLNASIHESNSQSSSPESAENAALKNAGEKRLLAQLEQAPKAGPPRSVWPSILKNGTQLIDAGRLQDALNVFQHYCRNRPQDPKGYFWTGVCFDEMFDYKNAVQAYQTAISKAEQNATDSAELRVNLGNTYLKLNETEHAIDAYKRALEINPHYPLAHLNMGRALLAANEFARALSHFNKCDELHFSAAQVPYYKAKAYLGLGRNAEAAALIKKLLQGMPDDKPKEEIEEEFRACLGAEK